MTPYEQYEANLHTLEVQAARYGMTPPLWILNDMAFHKAKLCELARTYNSRNSIHDCVKQYTFDKYLCVWLASAGTMCILLCYEIVDIFQFASYYFLS